MSAIEHELKRTQKDEDYSAAVINYAIRNGLDCEETKEGVRIGEDLEENPDDYVLVSEDGLSEKGVLDPAHERNLDRHF